MTDFEQIGPSDVAKMLGVTAMTVRRLSDKGIIKFRITPGGHRRYLKRDIIEYCQANNIALVDEIGSATNQSRILIVDDDQQFVQMLKVRIENSEKNYQIEIAYSGFEAGAKVQVFKPHIILTDIAMPGLTGIEMCRTLKADPNTKDIVIIGITGTTDKSDIEQLLAAGAKSCLLKPIKANELWQALS